MADKELFGNSEQLKLDTISRAAALKTAEWAYRACEDDLSYYHDLLVAALMVLAPAQPGWIPCKERLPEDGRVVLWCNEHGSVFTTAITARFDNSWAVGKRHRSSRMVAWMPLPEPYKEHADAD